MGVGCGRRSAAGGRIPGGKASVIQLKEKEFIFGLKNDFSRTAFFYVKKHANLFQSNGLERGQLA